MAVPNRNVGTRRRRIGRVLFWVGGNALLFALTWAFIAVVGEVWLRLQWPFLHSRWPWHFVPRVGYKFKPNVEVYATNHFDFWTVSRTNSWGFPDREPISPDRAAASCHIALIGDSFVAALEVPIADKVPVRLEALAAQVLPALNVTTAAFGINGTGQINQLPLYDEFARRLRPKLLVLVLVVNDFRDNSSVLKSLPNRWDPDRMPWMSARRDADGRMRMLPPHPDWAEVGPKPSLNGGRNSSPSSPVIVEVLPARRTLLYLMRRTLQLSSRRSYFATWLNGSLSRLGVLGSFDVAEALRRRPGYEALLGGWQPKTGQRVDLMFNEKDRPPFFEAALDFTAFGLDQFKERADRDGASLVILSTHTMRTRGDPAFDRLNALAAARGIPVIDQPDYIRRQGFKVKEAHWEHDHHWNAAGHQWAAEAVLEYLEQNREVCAQRPGSPIIPER